MKRIRFRYFLLAMASLYFPAAQGAAEPVKRVAMVFDDGPVPDQAVQFLELFETEGIRATFAQVASAMEQHPQISRRMQAAGHEIVNHSYGHRHASDLSDLELQREIGGAQEAMSSILETAPRWYWPPYLEVDERVRAAVKEAGIALYEPGALVSSDDWNREVSAEEIRRRATTGVADGAVILFHEWREETLEQLPAIIAELRRQNCVFLTFSELRRAAPANSISSAD